MAARRRGQQSDEFADDVKQVILSSSDTDYLDQLIPVLKHASGANRLHGLIGAFEQYADNRERDIAQVGLTQHDEFLGSVNQLEEVRAHTVSLTAEILDLNQKIQTSTQQLAKEKEQLVNVKSVKQNIAEASEALRESLKILGAVNDVHKLIKDKQYYLGLKALDDLQNEHLIPIIQNKYATQHKLAEIIQKSIPGSRKMISEAVMADLNVWLAEIRDLEQFLGEVAFFHTALRRTRQKDRIAANPKLKNFKLNSAVEMVYDESEELDLLDNEDVGTVDFVPLLASIHVPEALDQMDRFRSEYAATRRQQKELLIPASITLQDDPNEEGAATTGEVTLSSLLEAIAGFAIIEKATMKRIHGLRSQVDVDELWESMIQSAISLITTALEPVDNAEAILKIKAAIALFIQTMHGWGYSVTALDDFLLKLFTKYAERLKKRFSDDFQEIVATDDYMPMAIDTIQNYEKVISVSWYNPTRDVSQLTFPTVLPFSQMYPLCCIDIRNFLNQFYFFSDDHFQHPKVIDDTLKEALDDLLSEKVCKLLVERLQSQYLGQIVQILTNLEHFETACHALEQLLIDARSSSAAGGPIVLRATNEFTKNKETAEKRIFEVVNSKIDDLLETAEYEWMALTPTQEPSNYMSTLTGYLENIMSSTLLGLPEKTRSLVYFDALDHTTQEILKLPLSPAVTSINPNGVASLATDIAFLSSWVSRLPNALVLEQSLEELQQTVLLMQSDEMEYYDISVRNKKFGRVDPEVAMKLLVKLTRTVASPKVTDTMASNFSSWRDKLKG